jgi:hypothetical protein
VYRWIERTNKPQAYVQVFFDTVFMINVLTIFRIIASDDGFKIKKPKKSQEKITIMIPVERGERIGRFSALPEFTVEKRPPTRLGRHDAYVVPVGGDLQVDPGRIEALLLG